MKLPEGSVLVKEECIGARAYRVTLCINHISYGKYDAYEQRGGYTYLLYPAKGHRLYPPAPRGKFMVSVHDIVKEYAYC